MDLGIWLAQHGGIAHSQQAVGAGFTRYALRLSIAGGACVRIRRDWLALPTAPADLCAAAALGGRVACLSVARRLELWHLSDGMNHVSMPRNTAVPASETLRVHWSIGPMPVARFALVEPIENALVHIAECQPFENALVVWDSALNKKLVSQHSLARLHLRSAAACAVREVASGLADSGLETLPISRLAASGIRVSQQVMLEGHRVDGLIGSDSYCRAMASAFTLLPSSGGQTSRTIAGWPCSAIRFCATTTDRSCSTGHALRPKSSRPWPKVCTSRLRKLGDSEINRMPRPLGSRGQRNTLIFWSDDADSCFPCCASGVLAGD